MVSSSQLSDQRASVKNSPKTTREPRSFHFAGKRSDVHLVIVTWPGLSASEVVSNTWYYFCPVQRTAYLVVTARLKEMFELAAKHTKTAKSREHRR